MSKPQVRIVSDGTPRGTHIYVEDKEIIGVTAATVRFTTRDLATATLEIDDVYVETLAELQAALPPPERRRRKSVAVVGRDLREIERFYEATGMHPRDVIAFTPRTLRTGSTRGRYIDEVIYLAGANDAVWTPDLIEMCTREIEIAGRKSA